MPFSLRASQCMVTAALVAVASLAAISALHGVAVGFNTSIAVMASVALIGFLRNVFWGQFLASCIGALAIFFSLGLVLSDIEGNGQSVAERLLGTSLPVWLSWLIYVGITIFIVAPLYVVGSRKGFLRAAWW